eukprot:3158172-Rhodomonas_salina.1
MRVDARKRTSRQTLLEETKTKPRKSKTRCSKAAGGSRQRLLQMPSSSHTSTHPSCRNELSPNPYTCPPPVELALPSE